MLSNLNVSELDTLIWSEKKIVKVWFYRFSVVWLPGFVLQKKKLWLSTFVRSEFLLEQQGAGKWSWRLCSSLYGHSLWAIVAGSGFIGIQWRDLTVLTSLCFLFALIRPSRLVGWSQHSSLVVVIWSDLHDTKPHRSINKLHFQFALNNLSVMSSLSNTHGMQYSLKQQFKLFEVTSCGKDVNS